MCQCWFEREGSMNTSTSTTTNNETDRLFVSLDYINDIREKELERKKREVGEVRKDIEVSTLSLLHKFVAPLLVWRLLVLRTHTRREKASPALV